MMVRFSQWMQMMHKHRAAVSQVQLVLLAKQNAAHLVSYYSFPSIKNSTKKSGRDRFLQKSGRNLFLS